MPEAKMWHTTCHLQLETEAYFIGGYDMNSESMSSCCRLDICNQRYTPLGTLHARRFMAGAMKVKKHLWVFGGRFDWGKLVDCVERIDLTSNSSKFEVINL